MGHIFHLVLAFSPCKSGCFLSHQEKDLDFNWYVACHRSIRFWDTVFFPRLTFGSSSVLKTTWYEIIISLVDVLARPIFINFRRLMVLLRQYFVSISILVGTKVAQQTPQLTVGSRRVSKQFFWIKANSVKAALSCPIHQRVLAESLRDRQSS